MYSILKTSLNEFNTFIDLNRKEENMIDLSIDRIPLNCQ